MYDFCDYGDSSRRATAPVTPVLGRVGFPSRGSVVPNRITRVGKLNFTGRSVICLDGTSGRGRGMRIARVASDCLGFVIPMRTNNRCAMAVRETKGRAILGKAFGIPFIIPVVSVILPSNGMRPGDGIRVRKGKFRTKSITMLCTSFCPANIRCGLPLALGRRKMRFALPRKLCKMGSVVVVEKRQGDGLKAVAVRAGINSGLKKNIMF